MVILTKRVAGLSRDEFFEHYRTIHRQLARELPGLVSYQQAELAHGKQAWTAPEAFPHHDALSIYTFDSYDSARAAFDSAQGVTVDADTGTFIDWPNVLFIPATTFPGTHTPTTR
ncbi:EthD family reductase [Frigoribacterium sp. Leaf172]|uniref:EthD family reductase n=1 Tax=Frigoribacterium sp. Leaf172 TaxID=1736285 RepID=UPI00138F0486|nr:EthD family reductase [Frigoribacterium sp. Leaf172]